MHRWSFKLNLVTYESIYRYVGMIYTCAIVKEIVNGFYLDFGGVPC